VTAAISLSTQPKRETELEGLVYSLTARQTDAHLAWHQRPVVLGAIILIIMVALNVVFR